MIIIIQNIFNNFKPGDARWRLIHLCEFFDTLHLVRFCMGMEKYTQNRAQETEYTDRIVVLRSVNKIYPESYDFAARS
jgi:hypothetical protein